MTTNAKRLLDYLPFAGILVYSSYEWVRHYQPGLVIKWPTAWGLLLLFLIAVAFVKKHQLAVLLTGLTCFAGSFNLISISPAITTGYIRSAELNLPFYPDFVFIALLLFHFILSGRWYTGILTEKYWQDFKTGSHGR